MVKKHVPVLDSNNDEAAPALASVASESAEAGRTMILRSKGK